MPPTATWRLLCTAEGASTTTRARHERRDCAVGVEQHEIKTK